MQKAKEAKSWSHLNLHHSKSTQKWTGNTGCSLPSVGAHSPGCNSLCCAASAEDPPLTDFHPSSLQHACHFSNKIVRVETQPERRGAEILVRDLFRKGCLPLKSALAIKLAFTRKKKSTWNGFQRRVISVNQDFSRDPNLIYGFLNGQV